MDRGSWRAIVQGVGHDLATNSTAIKMRPAWDHGQARGSGEEGPELEAAARREVLGWRPVPEVRNAFLTVLSGSI